MLLADATVQSTGAGGVGLVLLIGFIILVVSSSSPGPEPLTDEEVDQFAEDAGAALRELWTVGMDGISMEEYFSSKAMARGRVSSRGCELSSKKSVRSGLISTMVLSGTSRAST